MYCIETNNLTHRFSAKTAVLKNVHLKVPRGSIYGFLGPNGAGKTTTLRLLLGLIRKQEGEIKIFEKPLQQNRVAILKNIGAMIESPSLYGQLTARENLLLLQKIYRCPVARINEVLSITGIAQTGNKKLSQFSLGMKQRLSIAVALLHNPSLLILDEPTNGLDPYGIIEIRDLLKKLNEEHAVTILISSHLLSEIEKLVTHVGIISQGTLVFQDTLKALREKQFSSSRTILNCSNIDHTKKVLQLLGLDHSVQDGNIILPVLPPDTIAKINTELVKNSIDVYEIATVRKDLETIFMELINQA